MGTDSHAVHDSDRHYRYGSIAHPNRYHSLKSRLHPILCLDGIIG